MDLGIGDEKTPPVLLYFTWELVLNAVDCFLVFFQIVGGPRLEKNSLIGDNYLASTFYLFFD
jgi:hypothetical protein